MTETFRLDSLKGAIEVGTTLTKSWFRGHSQAIGALVPRLFRPEYRVPIIREFRPDLELSTIEAFKRNAPMLSDLRLPTESDRFAWLCVMQHYRTPTRLLDWTDNVLVALYFTVSADRSSDGELWAMLPWELNNQSGAGRGIPILSRSPTSDIVADYFLAVNGTRIGQMGIEDEDMISFWHLSQIQPLSVWRPGCHLDGSGGLFPFADFNIDGRVWAIRLGQPDGSPVFMVDHDHTVQVAPSFEAFLEAYVDRRMDVVFSTADAP